MPASSSALVRSLASLAAGEESFPERSLILHLPQRAFPPQGASMRAPSSLERASSTRSPASTSTTSLPLPSRTLSLCVILLLQIKLTAACLAWRSNSI